MSDITERTQLCGRYFAFGSHVIDVVRGVLWRDGVLLHLRPKDIEILVLLIECRDRVVEKNEIFSRVWPGVVVEENNIARRISELRRVLGEGAGQRSFVATFPGRGYRFVADVEELTELPWGQEVSAPSTSAPLPSPAAAQIGWRSGLSVGLFVIAAIVTILAFVDRSGTAAPATPALARQFSFGAELHEHAAWSPDSRTLAYTSAHNGNSDIWLQDGADAKPRQITDSPAHDWQPTWSPDGRWLAFRSERDGGGIWLVDRDGQNERLLVGRGFAPQWSPDGQWILFSAAAARPSTAWPYIVAVGDPRPLPVLPDELAGSSNKYAGWHPDGRVSLWFRTGTGRWRFITTPPTGGPIAETIPFPSSNVSSGSRQAGFCTSRRSPAA
jgi:DNA-binding winged helix-turn-helix (wHTH) protein